MRSFGGFESGVEVGVRRGTNAINICKILSPRFLYLVDPYEPHLENDAELVNEWYLRAKGEISKFPNVFTAFIKDRSHVASLRFVRESIDFVYIDGLHDYKNIQSDLEDWVPKVKSGGIVAGHDYDNCEVCLAVREYITTHNTAEYVYVTFEEQAPSFFWVKQ